MPKDDATLSAASAGSVSLGFSVMSNDNKAGWIPVTERLPMDGEMVLCYGWNRGVEEAFRSKYWDGWVGPDKKNLVTHAYTHWMPLPAPLTHGK
jgi:hypothetical protein